MRPATGPVASVAFRTGIVRVVTGFGNEEVRVVTGFGNDDIKVLTGFGTEGSRVPQGFRTDAAGGKGSPMAVEAGGVIIAWGRSVRAASLRKAGGRGPGRVSMMSPELRFRPAGSLLAFDGFPIGYAPLPFCNLGRCHQLQQIFALLHSFFLHNFAVRICSA